MTEQYKQRRDFLYEKLTKMGCSMVKQNGAFYIFPSIKFTGLSSWDFASKLLEDEHVAIVPGSAFSEYGEGYLRISYASSMEVLEEAMERMERFIQNLKVTN